MRNFVEGKTIKKVKNLLPGIIYVVFGVGVVLRIFPASRGLALAVTPILLLGVNLLAILSVLAGATTSNRMRALAWVGIVYALTLAAEVIGVATGAIFGAYSYGEVLGFKLLEVPLIIGLNWVV